MGTPTAAATSTPSPSPTTPCRPFYASVAADRVARGGTADILFAAPLGSTIAATINAGAAYPRRATLLLPTERGGIQVRIFKGTRTGVGYRYTFPVGAFFGYGYALLSFTVPRNAPLGMVSVTATVREPGGCTATATTRVTVVAAGGARGGLVRSTAAWASRDVAGTPWSAARGVSLPATLSRADLSLSAAASAGGRPAAGGTAIATHGGSRAACRDTVVSVLPLRVTTASRIRVSGTAGYMLAGAGACSPMLYVALRGAAHATILATARVTTGLKLDRFALLGGGGALRGTGRGAGRDYVAAPGRYLLQLRLAPRNRGAGGLLALRVTALAYTQDRATATAGARR